MICMALHDAPRAARAARAAHAAHVVDMDQVRASCESENLRLGCVEGSTKGGARGEVACLTSTRGGAQRQRGEQGIELGGACRAALAQFCAAEPNAPKDACSFVVASVDEQPHHTHHRSTQTATTASPAGAS